MISDAHLDVARLLLSHGADVNKSGAASFTPCIVVQHFTRAELSLAPASNSFSMPVLL